MEEPFRRESEILEAASCHRAELAEDRDTLDGLPILMVLHPTVIACGASDGSDYNQRRVLKKAEVWMGGGEI